MSENTGGTVRYHRAEYLGDVSFPWEVWFDGGQGPIFFTAEQGEAMGLTPPPAPLVVECNGHSIELSDDEARYFATYYPANMPGQYNKRVSGAVKLAGLLRDARQDPQPASDPEPAPAPSDTLDFDAMPIGTVAEVTLLDGDRLLALKDGDGPDYKWYVGDSSVVDITRLRDVRVVYRPAPVSPYEGLRAVLAGRGDADRMIGYAARHWWVSNRPEITHPQFVLTGAVGDAARSGGATNG